MKRCIFIQFVCYACISSAQTPQPLWFNFDTIEPVYIDTNISANIWQIGKPSKIFFDSAFTFPGAILTDSINFYPANNLSEFTVKVSTGQPGFYGVNMRFVHKFDTDSLLDGGTIHVSGDGINWTTLLNSPAYFLPSLYNPFPSDDTIASLNDVGFSGKSNGWQQFWCYWNYPPSDTLWIKFIFASDGIQTNKEGWMIDSLYFHYDLGIGVNELNPSSLIRVYPNPVSYNNILNIATGHQTGSTVEIYNSQGILSYQNSYNEKHIKIDCSALISGIYILRYCNQQGITTTARFIK